MLKTNKSVINERLNHNFFNQTCHAFTDDEFAIDIFIFKI